MLNTFLFKVSICFSVVASSACLAVGADGEKAITSDVSQNTQQEFSELSKLKNLISFCSPTIDDGREVYSIAFSYLSNEKQLEVLRSMKKDYLNDPSKGVIHSSPIEHDKTLYTCSLNLNAFESIYLPEDLVYLSNVIKTVMVEGEKKVDILSLPQQIRKELLEEIKSYITTLHPSNQISFLFEKRIMGQLYTCNISSKVVADFNERRILGPMKEVLDSERVSNSGRQDKVGSIRGQTSSNLGDTIFHPNALTTILDDTIGQGNKVLEIGAARGQQTFKMLKKGARVTAVDLSGQDLSALSDQISASDKKNLTTIVAKFPEELKLDISNPDDKFDVIYMSHVAHYLTGDELREGINKISDLLKPEEGRFYFQALTPYSYPYAWRMIKADKLLSHEKKWFREHGNNSEDIPSIIEWPGYFSEDEKAYAQELNPNVVREHIGMPEYGHPMHADIIKRELERSGLTILYMGYLPLNINLSKHLLPISYQDQEAYIKTPDLNTIPLIKARVEGALDNLDKRLERLRNQKNPSTVYSYLQIMKHDRQTYQQNITNWKKQKPFKPLHLMDSIVVIACKNCQASISHAGAEVKENINNRDEELEASIKAG